MNRTIRIAALIVAAGVASPELVAAQSVDSGAVTRLRDEYVADLDSVHVKIVALASAIPEAKYRWRPAAGVRSVSEVLMHLTGEWFYYCPLSVAAKPPPDFGVPRERLAALEKLSGKADVTAQLQQSWTYCRAALAGADPTQLAGRYKPWNVTLGQAAFGMTGDQHEHLGQLVAYARSIGVTPPWSK